MLRWFDHYVKGIPDPTLKQDIAPVTYHQIGSGQWLRAQSWPPAGTTYRALNLGGQATPLADLKLGRPGTLGAASSGGPDTLPFVPVAGACGRGTTQWTAGAAVLCDRDNRLADLGGISYDLPVTGKPLDLAGPLAARLYVSSAAKDAAVTVKVEDVYPSGHVDQISSGTQVLSLRALDRAKTVWQDGYAVVPWHPMTRESQQPMPKNTPVPVDVEILPTAAQIAPGHRLRITISAADFPQHLPTVPSLLDSVGNLGGGLKIWHDAAHPSYLVVPQSRS
jgi:putative CocE/NonD family hydrolase